MFPRHCLMSTGRFVCDDARVLEGVVFFLTGGLCRGYPGSSAFGSPQLMTYYVFSWPEILLIA